jgi:pSer/pThr/pTyr-binding forkhead associated (FHA) protein
MTLNIKDDQILSVTFPVTSNTDYPGPPSPVTAQFAGLQLNAAKQAYEVQLNMTSPELVDYVKISVWDKSAGSKAGEYVFKSPSANNTFLIPTEALTANRAYELRIVAVSKTDSTPFDIVRNEDGKLSKELLHEFTFDPSAAYPNLQVQSVTEKSGDLVLSISVTNPDLIGGFDGWLVDENTNTQVAGSNFTSPAITSTTGSLTIPMRTKRVPDGKYTLVVRVLAKNNNVYSTTTYQDISYKAPTLFERLGVALIAAPIILVAIVTIILGLVGFLMFNASRQKAMSGTPVMQGQLGGGLKGSGRAAGPVIPVADDEPVLSQGRVPAAPVVSAPPPLPSAPPPAQPVSARPPADATLISGDALPEGATVISSAPVMQTASITVLQAPGGAAQRPVPVSPLPFVIGRTEGNLIIQDMNISRRHIQITYDGSRRAYFLTDLGSSNGTYLNGQRLTANQPVQLSSGLVIGLGPNVTIRFDLR